MSEFYIGQIIEGLYPPEAADFCNNSQGTDNPCYIKEIEPMNGKRMFKIVPNEPMSEKEIKQQEISKYQMYLSETDWYVYRAMDTGEPVPVEIKQKRQEARDEISRLREELEKL